MVASGPRPVNWKYASFAGGRAGRVRQRPARPNAPPCALPRPPNPLTVHHLVLPRGDQADAVRRERHELLHGRPELRVEAGQAAVALVRPRELGPRREVLAVRPPPGLPDLVEHRQEALEVAAVAPARGVQRVPHELRDDVPLGVQERRLGVHVHHAPPRRRRQRRQLVVHGVDRGRVLPRLRVLPRPPPAPLPDGPPRPVARVRQRLLEDARAAGRVRHRLARRRRHLLLLAQRRPAGQDPRQHDLRAREHGRDGRGAGFDPQEGVVGVVPVPPEVVGPDHQDHRLGRVPEAQLAALEPEQQVLRAVAGDAEGERVPPREGLGERPRPRAQLLVPLPELRPAHRLGDGVPHEQHLAPPPARDPGLLRLPGERRVEVRPRVCARCSSSSRRR